MDGLQSVKTARDLLADVTPLRTDCGRLCGAACCRESEAGCGMLLFPYEEALYAPLPSGFSLMPHPAWEGALMLVCPGRCARRERPLACRIFPLLPLFFGEEARLSLDVRAWPVCPLMDSGLGGLRQDFVARARQAVRLLLEDEAQRAFMKRLSVDVAAYRRLDGAL